MINRSKRRKELEDAQIGSIAIMCLACLICTAIALLFFGCNPVQVQEAETIAQDIEPIAEKVIEDVIEAETTKTVH